MLSVYIAAPYPMRSAAIQLMRTLEVKGIEVTSRWLKEMDTLDNASAIKDLADIARADVLLALNPEGWENKGTGGRHVELGYALGLNKAIVLVGRRTNMFHHLDIINMVVDNVDNDEEIAARIWALQRSES